MRCFPPPTAILAVLIAQVPNSGGTRPSPGCSTDNRITRINKHFPFPLSNLNHQPFLSPASGSPKLPPLKRHWLSYFPKSYFSSIPMPLLLYFHGQGGDAKDDAESGKYNAVGEKSGFATLYLQGIGKEDGGKCGTGWNVGASQHNLSTCTAHTRSKACDCTCCYDSCKTLGLCTSDNSGSTCGWATCYDDVGFVKALVGHVADEACIDMDAIYATGASNGGMFVHHLASVLQEELAGIVPVYGLPLKGALDVPSTLANTPIMAMHDRSDATIPISGGPSDDGWSYVPLAATLAKWAEVHGCAPNQVSSYATPYDGGDKNIVCLQHSSCDGRPPNGQIVQCLFDGEHGSWFGHAEALTWWFLHGKNQNNTNDSSSRSSSNATRTVYQGYQK